MENHDAADVSSVDDERDRGKDEHRVEVLARTLYAEAAEDGGVTMSSLTFVSFSTLHETRVKKARTAGAGEWL